MGQMAGGGEPVGQGQTDEVNNMVGMRHRLASTAEEVHEPFLKLFEKVSVSEPQHLPERQFGRTQVIKTSGEF